MNDQGELLPTAEFLSDNGALTDLNRARFSAFKHAEDAVVLLVRVMNDVDVDLDQRCICAAELLQFIAKGF